MANQGCEFNFFKGTHVRIDIRINISISLRPLITKIWQAGTTTGFDSNETNEAGSDDVITSKSRDKIKHYISATRVPMATKLGKMVTYLDGALT